MKLLANDGNVEVNLHHFDTMVIMMHMRTTLLLVAGVLGAADPSPANCAVGQSNDPRCDDDGYRGAYPECAVFQYGDRRPIPCAGEPAACDAARPTPAAASWHVHVFFPNVDCANNCSAYFTRERASFTFAGALRLRASLATFLNDEAARIKGAPLRDPTDAARASTDLSYSRCTSLYKIAAGAPANFIDEPCIYEVDPYKEDGGPFSDPVSDLGYPNWSFFIPSDFWLPGLKASVVAWLGKRHGEYDVLFHPNTGCEARDHVGIGSPDITWLGTARPLKPSIFSCNALGCNQACPSSDPPPANCSAGLAL